MSSLSRRLGPVLLVLLLAGPSWAEAACQQRDIRGSWDLYIAGGEVDGPWFGWSACNLSINNTGAVRGSCINDDGTSNSIVDGQLDLRNNCRIRGEVLIDGDVEAPFSFTRATLTESKDLIAGVGRTSFDAFLFSAIFQMVRR